MRTRNSILNIFTNLIFNFLNIILTFVVRTIFIKYLGSSYLGLNGLLTNVLSMLSLAELGFGTAITFSLYKPLSDKDNDKISALMTFYKKTYFAIGILILVIGTILSFFLKYIIKEYYLFPDINIIYFLYLFNTAFWYFISYKETLINADQKNYKLSKYNFIFKILVTIFEIVVLIVYKNYILYLISQFIIELIKRIFVNKYITKEYKEIDFNSKNKIQKEERDVIKKNVKAMIFHKIGEYCINGTDNIILSSAVSISIVGIYSNYLLIINTITTFLKTIFRSIISSIGNLLVDKVKDDRKVAVFNEVNFMGFIFYGLSSLLLYFLFNIFITWWIGDEFIFDSLVVLLIVLNFYFTGMRVPLASFKSAAGIYDEDKYNPLIQAAINLVVSIVLVKYIGITGVLLGTLISSLALPSWHRAYIICKCALHISPKYYYIEFLKYFSVLTFDYFVLTFLFNYINISIPLIKMMVISICTTIVFLISVMIVFRNSEEYIYIEKNVKKIWRKVCKKI